MSGKPSRDKGARGEREVAKLLEGRRTGQMQSQQAATEGDVESGLPKWDDTFHTEVKRQERIQMNKWSEQAKLDALDSEKIPLVVYRTNGQPWRVSIDLDDFLFLWKFAHRSEDFPAPSERF